MRELASKNAVVTGGGSGIGRGLVRALAEAGMAVAVADIEGDAAAAVAEEVGGRPFVVDVSSLESVSQLASDVFAAYGSVDVLCNNAGVGLGGPIERMTADDWRWTFGVNVGGVINGLISFLPRLRSQGTHAHIVNTASAAGLFSRAGAGPYCASKAAVIAISEALREELSDAGIGVTVVCPFFVRTRISESARNRPAHMVPTQARPPQLPSEGGDDPDEIGRVVRQAILDDRLYVIPFAEQYSGISRLISERFELISSALGTSRSDT
jgi:NAD(P)-dependent dehydrogenase (short-subunit alcohol dehydrogenase family)